MHLEKRPISCKYVFKINYKTDGLIERCKARLVIRGFTQREGIDYTETFSSMVKITSFVCLIDVHKKEMASILA